MEGVGVVVDDVDEDGVVVVAGAGSTASRPEEAPVRLAVIWSMDVFRPANCCGVAPPCACNPATWALSAVISETAEAISVETCCCAAVRAAREFWTSVMLVDCVLMIVSPCLLIAATII